MLAGVIVVSVTNGGSEAPLALVGKDFADTAEYLGLAVFAAFLVMFSKVVLSGKRLDVAARRLAHTAASLSKSSPASVGWKQGCFFVSDSQMFTEW